MNESNINSAHNSDELDLIVLIEKLVSFVKRFFFILIVFPVIGILIGFLLFLSTPRKYTSETVLHSFVLTNLENIQIIKNWKDLLRKKRIYHIGGHLEHQSRYRKKSWPDGNRRNSEIICSG